LDRYVHAWEDADAGLLAAILKEDALFTMPPVPEWFKGREAIYAFVLKELFRGAGAGFGKALAVRANAQPSYALYRRDSDERSYRAFGSSVLAISDDAIAAIATFLGEGLFPKFNLPAELPS
jgi:RNA polymerase sigma-70 factor, ECF subfamily